MEVGLVNDGPVGIDYRSDNGAVRPVARMHEIGLMSGR